MRQPHSGSPIEMQMALERSWVCNLYDLAHQSHTIRLSQQPAHVRVVLEHQWRGALWQSWQHSVVGVLAIVQP